MDSGFLKIVELIVPLILMAVGLGMLGRFAGTGLRIKHGHAVDDARGMPIHPRKDREINALAIHKRGNS